MKKQIIIIGIILMMITVCLIGCQEELNNKEKTDSNDNSETTKSEEFEGTLGRIGDAINLYIKVGEYAETGFYILTDNQGEYYDSLEEFELGDTVIIKGKIGTYENYSAIIVEDISFKYPECENDEELFVGTWRQDSGITTWGSEGAIWYFYENKSLRIEDSQFDKGYITGIWNVYECNLSYGTLLTIIGRFDYEFSDNNNKLTYILDHGNAILTKVSN